MPTTPIFQMEKLSTKHVNDFSEVGPLRLRPGHLLMWDNLPFLGRFTASLVNTIRYANRSPCPSTALTGEFQPQEQLQVKGFPISMEGTESSCARSMVG